VVDSGDNCPFDYNRNQEDRDSKGPLSDDVNIAPLEVATAIGNSTGAGGYQSTPDKAIDGIVTPDFTDAWAINVENESEIERKNNRIS
jgi:hypothetical protein